jgi:hypothetical protein
MCRSTAPSRNITWRQPIDARTDMAQVLEDDVAGFVSHWTVSVE